MTLYLSIISATLLILIGFNSLVATEIFATDAKILNGAILKSFFAIVFINMIIPIFFSILPKKWFGVDNKNFDVSNKERKFYEAIHIRRWKDKIWELGWLGGFSKRQIKEPHNIQYVEKFIVESNKGMVGHLLRIVFGFCIIGLFPQYLWNICLPIVLVNMFLNLLPIMVLRYNLPKLKILYTRLVRENAGINDQEQLITTATNQ